MKNKVSYVKLGFGILLLLVIIGLFWWFSIPSWNLNHVRLTLLRKAELEEALIQDDISKGPTFDGTYAEIDLQVVFEYFDDCSIVYAIFVLHEGEPYQSTSHIFYELHRNHKAEWYVEYAEGGGRRRSQPDSFTCED